MSTNADSPAPATTWLIRGIKNPKLEWGGQNGYHRCRHCNVELLKGEKAGFCCGKNGAYANIPSSLPPLPEEYDKFLSHPHISGVSRLLNLIFSFAALESSHDFPPLPPGGPAFLAMEGRLYHRVRPNHDHSAIRWLLYDGFSHNAIPHAESQWVSKVPTPWIDSLQTALLRVSPFVGPLLFLASIDPLACPTAHIRLDGGAPNNEIAAVLNYDNTTLADVNPRQSIVVRHSGENQKISAISRLWEPLAYPLLFPHGDLGWGVVDTHSRIQHMDADGAHHEVETESSSRQIMHYRARLLREDRFRTFGKLTNEYAVDMLTRNLETRLNYIRANQTRLRQADAELMGEDFVPDSQNIYLPVSFMGSRRWASDQIADSLTIAAHSGNPTFFVTMTCNANWPEISSRLRAGQDFSDIPTDVIRVFKQKLAALEQCLKTMFPNAGRMQYLIHSVEFQKHGLPHAHILCRFQHECVHPDDIDKVVSAEIPSDPVDEELVRSLMMHRHPPADKPPSRYCQREENGQRICRFGYPKPLQQHTMVDSEGRVHYRRRNPGDEWVVPHCLPLLRKYNCHVNFEAASSSHLFQYLFKYIHKSPDYAKYGIRVANDATEPVDEIDDYWRGRYLSTGEAVWCILGFNITKKEPSVTAMSVHLEDDRTYHQYQQNTPSGNLSTLRHYFLRPLGVFSHHGAMRVFADLTYIEYYSLFRLAKFDHRKAGHENYYVEQDGGSGHQPMHVILRMACNRHYARLREVSCARGEVFYLRALLEQRPASSFRELRTVDGVEHASFQEAACQLGIFAAQNEAEYALSESIRALKTPAQLRFFFVHLLVTDCILTPLQCWNTFQHDLCLDFSLRYPDAVDYATQQSLDHVARLLEEHGKRPADYQLPDVLTASREVEHELRKWAPFARQFQDRVESARSAFNSEQEAIFTRIVSAVEHQQSLLLFVDGKAGVGKTFLINAICDKLRSQNMIALPSATSAFATQLYQGGRTVHSTFKIPVNEKSQMLTSPIQRNDPRAQLIHAASVITIDEASMLNKAAFGCAEEVCRSVMNNNEPFGGKVVILLGDFRQTCPVIPGGTRNQVIDACIQSSPLWSRFTICHLHQLIRNAQDPEYAAFVNSIGDGAGPDISLAMLPCTSDIDDFMHFVFPPAVLRNPQACLGRGIIAPTNRQVDEYNAILLNRVQGTFKQYFAADSFKEAEDSGLASEAAALHYVTLHTPPGLPPHCLTIKTNGVFRLLRNFSVDHQLVKNVRVVVTDVGHRIITVKHLMERPAGTDVSQREFILPRINFSHQLHSGHTLIRRQFPLAPAYCTTIHSCQGLTFNKIAVDLTTPVFTHGQLYTALSRIRHREDALVRIRPNEETTKNMTYRELLLSRE